MITTYKSGETPRVGDTIKIAKNHNFDCYTSIRHETGKRFKVERVFDGAASKLMFISHLENGCYDEPRGYKRPNPVSCKNFELVERFGGVNSNTDKVVEYKTPLYVVFEKNTNKFTKYSTLDSLQSSLVDLVKKNLDAEYEIYTLENIAKAKPVALIYNVPTHRTLKSATSWSDTNLFNGA